MDLSPAAIAAAATRLRGQLVATPLIGGLWLPGFPCAADVRLKPELLQPGGAVWYRGACHFLLRQMGRCRGVAIRADGAVLRAAAMAARAHRMPLLALVGVPPGPEEVSALEAADAAVRVVPVPAGSRPEPRELGGFTWLAGPADPDYALGLATVGLELARDLPAGCEVVLVAPGLGSAVAAGLSAGGRSLPVVEVPPGPPPEGLAAALAAGHRLHSDAAGCSVLAAALARQAEGVAVVLGS